MQTRIDAKLVRVHFESLHAMGEYIARSPRVWKQNGATSNNATGSWDLNAGYDGAVKMARYGWPEGAERTQDALKAFPTKTPEPDTKVDFYGFRPHVPRYCAGAPDSMIRRATQAETGSGKVLTLYVSVMSPSFSTAACMANYGVGIAQYVNQMEMEGRRVEVIACATVSGHGKRHTVSCTVKNADQPLDLAALAFALGHPAMLRRIWFAYMERQTDIREMSTYGYCCDTNEGDLIDPAPGTFVLNGMNNVNTHASTPVKALAYVTKKIDAALKAQEL